MTMTMTDESFRKVRINDHLGGFILATRRWAEEQVERGRLARTDHPRIFEIVPERLDQEARAMAERLAKKPRPRKFKT